MLLRLGGGWPHVLAAAGPPEAALSAAGRLLPTTLSVAGVAAGVSAAAGVAAEGEPESQVYTGCLVGFKGFALRPSADSFEGPYP